MVTSPDRLPLSPRRPYLRKANPPPPPELFTQFSKLPTELRLKIWKLSMAPDMFTRIVPIHWDPTLQTFTSSRRPPVQLHVCRELRYEALAIYSLCFSPTEELARTYFSFEQDMLQVIWASLGAVPGRIGSKIAEQELENVKSLMINEEALVLHAIANMKELARFEGVEEVMVICDSDNPQSGQYFGMPDINNYEVDLGYDSDEERHFDDSENSGDEEVVDKRVFRWPRLECLREHEDRANSTSEPRDRSECGRHWWFGWWNHCMRRMPQKYKWTTALADCLLLSLGPEPHYVDRDSEEEEEDFDDEEDDEIDEDGDDIDEELGSEFGEEDNDDDLDDKSMES